MAIHGPGNIMEGITHYLTPTYIKFGIPVYVGHLLADHQTSWVGSVLVIFSVLVTIGVAAYLYRAFREFKSHHVPLPPEYALQEGETEFEVAPEETFNGTKPAERTALVTRTSNDDFFFDEEEEIGR